MAPFTVTHLHSGRLDEAYPLARMAAPEAGLDEWRRYAGWLAGAEGGVLAAFAGNSTLHGIAAYCRDDSLRHGRTLRVDLIVTFELSSAAPARAALVEALELLARAKQCDSLTVALPDRGHAAAARAQSWSGLGFAPDSACFRKLLSPAPCGSVREPAIARSGG